MCGLRRGGRGLWDHPHSPPPLNSIAQLIGAMRRYEGGHGTEDGHACH